MHVFPVFQMVGTATRASMPDVPMFTVTPAKRPRRQALSDTLTAVGQTIASALTPGAGRPRESETEVEQVNIPRHFQRFALFHCAFNIPTISISLLSRSAIPASGQVKRPICGVKY